MSAEKRQRGLQFTQAITDVLVQTYGKHQVSKLNLHFITKPGLPVPIVMLYAKTVKKEVFRSLSFIQFSGHQSFFEVTTAVNAVNIAERKTVEQVNTRLLECVIDGDYATGIQ